MATTNKSTTFSCPKGFTTANTFPDHVELDSLTENHELVLIKTPWDFDITQLNGHRISLESLSEVIANNKKIFIDTSDSTGHLKNIAMMMKDSERNYQFPVGQVFKKQIEISECYNFPPATIPENKKLPVATPQNLRERFRPYGSDAPSIYYRKKFRKSTTEHKTNDQSPKRKKSSFGLDSSFNDSKDMVEQFDSQESKRNKKRKIKQELIDDHEPSNWLLEGFESLNDRKDMCELSDSKESKRKKKIKKKQELDLESSNQLLEGFEEQIVSVPMLNLKKKRKKCETKELPVKMPKLESKEIIREDYAEDDY